MHVEEGYEMTWSWFYTLSPSTFSIRTLAMGSVGLSSIEVSGIAPLLVR